MFADIIPAFASIRIVDKYDYSDYIDKINISSNTDTVHIRQEFSTPRTTFYLQFQNISPESPEDIEVEWNIDGKLFHRHLDWDNEA
jgi:hypothetical protein